MFKYSDSNKRYHTLNYYYRKRYGCKISKISLNLGLSCPNIDGYKGYGGCIYCKAGSGEFAGDKRLALKDQFLSIKEIMDKKWDDSKYIAYFQANSNTYAPVSFLKKNFEEVLGYEDVVGINVATRCDVISDEVLDYLSDLNKRTDLTIELGLQTINEDTAKFINRGHTLDEFTSMVEKLKKRDIKVVVHIMNGLPGEEKEDMLNTVKFLNKLGIDGIKIHMLYIVKGTKLALMYKDNPFHLLSLEEYVDIVCDQLELLDEKIVVNRVTGDPKREDLIAPDWLLKKFVVMNEIDKEMVRRNSYQGIKKT